MTTPALHFPPSSPWVRLAAAVLSVAALAGTAVFAQSTASPSPPAASGPVVPPPLRPSPLVTSPSDAARTLDSNNEPAGGKVMPQVRIPLGKKSGPPVFERQRAPTAGQAAPASLIDDSAARCESERDKQVRARCRNQLTPAAVTTR